MKPQHLTTAILLSFLIFVLNGCSREDAVIPNESEYFSASIDGEGFHLDNLTGILRCEKLITEMGTVNLEVTLRTEQGESIEFLILNYTGKRSYTFGDSFNNKNRISYGNDLGIWSTGNDVNSNRNALNILEISEDSGAFLKGFLSFEGHDPQFLSRKSVTNGKFTLKVHPVE